MRSSRAASLAARAAVACAAFAGGSVSAADLGGAPVRPPRDFSPPYYSESALPPWAGFYLGGTLGYSFGDATARGDIGNFPFAQDGMTGTLLAGYNWQVGRGVFGLETDIGTGNFGASKATPFGQLQTDMNFMGSFRARAGFLVTPALMLYGTAGLAWANMDVGFAGEPSRTETLFGYQVGTGAELMVSRNVGLRLEYIYTDLERERIVHSGQTNTYDSDFHTVRAGVTFKF